MEKKDKKPHIDTKLRNDVLLFAAVLIVCIVVFSMRELRSTAAEDGAEAMIIVTIDDRTVLSCPLKLLEEAESEEELLKGAEVCDTEFIVFTEEGVEVWSSLGYNVIKYREDAEGIAGVVCSEADCSDKVCVDTGYISLDTEAIVCLPHRLIARLGYR